MKNIDWFALLLGILAGGTLVAMTVEHVHIGHPHDDSHPVGYADSEDEVHVHSDLIVYLSGTEYDLTDDKYQSKTGHILHADIHLHDNNDEVIHRHGHEITLADFFTSLGFTLTNDCIIDAGGVEYCSDDSSELMVFVNDERVKDFTEYENKEEDRILIYYGDPDDSETINSLLLSVTDKACIYSGTCPERGVAPPESCGLTCEL